MTTFDQWVSGQADEARLRAMHTAELNRKVMVSVGFLEEIKEYFVDLTDCDGDTPNKEGWLAGRIADLIERGIE